LELMVRSGRPITDSLLTLVPEAFRDQPELDDKPAIKAFYEFNACLQEPWDGPALLVFSDGRTVGATLDRNGLRPARYCITSDGYVVMGSETGVVELDESLILEKGRLGPGQMLAVDLERGLLLRNWDVKRETAERLPYGSWLAEHRRSLAPGSWQPQRCIGDLDLLALQTAFGFSAEDLEFEKAMKEDFTSYMGANPHPPGRARPSGAAGDGAAAGRRGHGAGGGLGIAGRRA
jgi:glutamate synthase (ferredoxin)